MTWLMTEYVCRRCDERIESLEDRGDVRDLITHLGCGGRAARAISAPAIGTVWATAVTRARSDEPPPHVLNTQPLADGMSLREFKKQRKKERHERRWKQIKRALS